MDDGKDLLLFKSQRRKGLYQFVGSFNCSGWEEAAAPDANGATCKAIIFLLTPSDEDEAKAETAEAVYRSNRASLDELRQLAYSAVKVAPSSKESRRTCFDRSVDVKAYVLARAQGRCESCRNPAPFVRKDGSPYLEPHHTRRLADGGPDHPLWVGAICPSCHRNIHHGKDGHKINQQLIDHIQKVERESIPT